MTTQFQINCILMAKNVKNEPMITILIGDKSDIIASQQQCHPIDLIQAECSQKIKNALIKMQPGDPITATGEIENGNLNISNLKHIST